jgi:hypothetical protein
MEEWVNPKWPHINFFFYSSFQHSNIPSFHFGGSDEFV